jgi:hypothetical protein
MREGSLEAPKRHKIDWQNPDFHDRAKIDAEMHRVFDICHGCRRCFNLCDSFPRLFDLVDASPTEVAGVDVKDYARVVEACTLCDVCFMTKCPYVPPHEWAVDFPHLMLRYRAADFRDGKPSWSERQLTETDRNGKLAGAVAPLANWSTKTGNGLTRPLMEKVAGAWAQGGALRHLLRQLQQPRHRRGDARGAGQERRRHRGGVSPLLRHAAARARRHRPRRRDRRRGGGGARALYRARL